MRAGWGLLSWRALTPIGQQSDLRSRQSMPPEISVPALGTCDSMLRPCQNRCPALVHCLFFQWTAAQNEQGSTEGDGFAVDLCRCRVHSRSQPYSCTSPTPSARARCASVSDDKYGCCLIRSFWRTKASLIYRRTKNLRVVQLLLGHSKLESTVRYLGIEVDDALEISEQTEV